MKELKEALIQLFNLEGVSADDIGDDDALFNEGLGLDSVDAIELTIFLDNTYGIRFANMAQSEAALASVRALQAYINAHTAALQPQK